MIRWILRQLRVRCWGVKWEVDLPPEFIITKHAGKRILERDSVIIDDPEVSVQKAWYLGKEPGENFDPERCSRPVGFKEFSYKEYGNLIYCFGVRRYGGNNNRYRQKYLLTVLPKR